MKHLTSFFRPLGLAFLLAMTAQTAACSSTSPSADQTASGVPSMTTQASPLKPAPTPTPTPSGHGLFVDVGPMQIGRIQPTATLLNDGRVLVVGGLAQSGSVPTSSAEIFDPASGEFSTTASMHAARWGNTATLLGDGRVLVAGGEDGSEILRSAELYDPTTGKFSPTGEMSEARSRHSATLLEDGRVLVAGGEGPATEEAPDGATLASAEIFDPASGEFTPVGSLIQARSDHSASLLADGTVLLAGGLWNEPDLVRGLSSAELFDPATGQFAATGSMTVARPMPASAVLADGRVLLVAGELPGFEGGSNLSHPAELYDPTTGQFITAVAEGPDFTWAATLLRDGRVLLMLMDGQTAEAYDPATGALVAAGKADAPIGCDSATLLRNGEVLFLGDGGNAAIYWP